MSSQGSFDVNARGRFCQQRVCDELEERKAGGRVAHLYRPLRQEVVRPHVRHEVEGERCTSPGGDDLHARAAAKAEKTHV